MVNVTRAPEMKIRCHHSDNAKSFDTTETIYATKAALQEYMQKQPQGRPFSQAELDSLRYRHRTSRLIANDKVRVEVAKWWDAPWLVLYIRDEDLAEGNRVAAQTKRKPHYTQTAFGYCEQFPVA